LFNGITLLVREADDGCCHGREVGGGLVVAAPLLRAGGRDNNNLLEARGGSRSFRQRDGCTAYMVTTYTYLLLLLIPFDVLWGVGANGNE